MSARLHGVVVGLGHMGAHHLRKLATRADVRVRAVDPPKGLDAPVGQPDFAIIAVPTRSHLDVALPLLEAGVPCLVEKPLAASLEQASRLVAFPHCLPGHIERFNPVFQVLDGARPRYLEAERMGLPSGRSGDVDVVLDLMIHDLDLVRWLLPSALRELRSVGLGLPREPGKPPPGVDIANVRLETADGRVANLSASRISRRNSRRLRLFTERDYWSLDLGLRRAERIRWADGSLEVQAVPVPDIDPLEAEHEALLAHVRGDIPYPLGPHDGLEALELALRVTRAMARGDRAESSPPSEQE
jgi:predicted dehydrogenase